MLRSRSFIYRKAMAQQVADGSYRVVMDVRKSFDGTVQAKVYQDKLPSMERAKRLSKVLNLCLG